MKKILRLTASCLALILLATVIPFASVAAVSIPSSLKSVVFNATYYAGKYADLKAAFGTENLEENLEYVACILGKKNTATADDTIRNYFIKNKDT